jgi:peptidoglycan LD-endopeptidase CwlK
VATLMPNFSAESKKRLTTCHPNLQRLFKDVIQAWDCTILEGERDELQQAKNVAAGVSRTMDSLHLKRPSEAVDVAPYPVRWPQRPKPNAGPGELIGWAKELARFYHFAGYVRGRAQALGINVRYGGDWDGDHDIHDQDFDDLVHWELR